MFFFDQILMKVKFIILKFENLIIFLKYFIGDPYDDVNHEEGDEEVNA